MSTSAVTFDQALDAVESLPIEQQADLVEVVRRRHAERRRLELVESVRTAREEHAAGLSRVATVAEIMRAIEEEEP